LFIAAGVCCDAIAQAKFSPESDKKNNDSLIVESKAHYKLSKEALRDSIYRFHDFQYGRVTFSTGFSPEEKLRLNYNLYRGQMDLITNDGDTSQVQRFKYLKLVTIGNHLFYHDNKIGYIEIVYQSPIALGVLRRLSTVDLVTASESETYYKKEEHYYFLDVENNPTKATQSAIVKLFKQHKDAISTYVKDRGVNFDAQNDLINLLRFCNQLDQGPKK